MLKKIVDLLCFGVVKSNNEMENFCPGKASKCQGHLADPTPKLVVTWFEM